MPSLLQAYFYPHQHVPEIIFLSYSFVMFRIDFLLSIWVNLHIYIDIVMFGFWVEISTIIISLYCTWQIKHFGEKSKLQPMSFNLGINFIWYVIYKFVEFEGFYLVLK